MNAKLTKRALKLSYFTIIYNIAEGILAIFADLTKISWSSIVIILCYFLTPCLTAEFYTYKNVLLYNFNDVRPHSW